MKSMPVSVVIPVRNGEQTIGYAIASVLEQTMPDLEIIVVDDASTDGTAEVVSSIRDPRLKLLRSERNIREAAARNLGMRNAKGKWIAFLDADDEWVPERIENLLRAAGDDGDCFVGDRGAVCVPGPGGRLVPMRQPNLPDGFAVEDLDFVSVLGLKEDVKPMIPRELSALHGVEFPEWGSGGEWLFLNARLTSSGIRGRLLQRVGYLWRGSGAHDSSTLHAKEEMLKVLEFLLADSSLPAGGRELLKSKMGYVEEGLVASAIKERNVRKFVQYVARRPGALLRLPRRTVLFGLAKFRVRLANIAATRTRPAVEAEPASANESRQA